jgi:hypothetical protein
MALELASPRLKADKSIVLTACTQNGDALQFVPAFQSDPEVFAAATVAATTTLSSGH